MQHMQGGNICREQMTECHLTDVASFVVATV
eukprot:SAG25_NODE_12737_length_276_cov_0.570621_1_plen_30_part_10